MPNETDHRSTSEEVVDNMASRTLNDAESIKGGAGYVVDEGEKLRLDMTPEQVQAAHDEMKEDHEKRPWHLSKALLILCQGFLANKRGREMHLAAWENTEQKARSKEWWQVPIIARVIKYGDLAQAVSQELGGNVPPPVVELVDWLKGDREFDEQKLDAVVAGAYKELQSRGVA